MSTGLDVKKLVDAFLAWPLPESVYSDLCACMPGYPHRSGTNLLTADEARQMFEHVLARAALDGRESTGRDEKGKGV